MGTALPHCYGYSGASSLEGGQLKLVVSGGSAEEQPHFFTGRLRRPQQTAHQLLTLMKVVQARHHIPAAMLERILIEADPVVTCGAERLRFEGFSACCGVYARVDLLPGAVEGFLDGKGSTNVDFNEPMRTALARVGTSDEVTLSVGREEVVLQAGPNKVVERKVKLPLRWIRGFLEVQAVCSRMTPKFTLSAPQARRFMTGLPRMKTHRRATFIVPSGQGVRLSQVPPQVPHVRVGGLERLRPLERLMARAQRLEIHGDELTGASAWVVYFNDSRFTLALSPEVWRGFSGEGQALDDLAADWPSVVAGVRARLHWGSAIQPDLLAREAGLDPSLVSAALAALGARGLVGFDVAEGRWFHRELPFDLDAVETLQPRLRNARKLIEAKAVRQEPGGEHPVFWVKGSGLEHRVVLADSDRCTCTWFAKHGGERGPCKHLLAARLLLEEG